MGHETQNIGVTLKQGTRSCGCNSPDRKKFRFDKLKYKKETYSVGLSSLKTWDNPPMASPKY
jgi:hypothetical protein